jgi:hypothetical protein
MKYGFAIAFLLLVSQLASTQISFECAIDSNRLLIGDQRWLHLRVISSTDFSPDTISFTEWEKLGIETLTPQQWQNERTDGHYQMIRVVAFDTGYIKLPPLELTYETNLGRDTTYSNDLVLEVSGITIDSTGLAPIKPILREPFKFRDAMPYVIALVLGLLLIGLIFFRKKKTVPEPTIVEIPIPPDEIALTDLEKLRGKKLWQQGKIKDYQSELTHIIRSYIEARFAIPALESTTSEILQYPVVRQLNQELLQDLDQILNIADLIKFAKAQPDVGVHEQFMQKAERFVLTTRKTLPDQDV